MSLLTDFLSSSGSTGGSRKTKQLDSRLRGNDTFMRVVSLSPSFTEILTAIGAASELVGVTDNCPSREKLPGPERVGSVKALNLAVIEALKPDLVLVDMGQNRFDEIRPIEAKFPAAKYDVLSPADVMDVIHDLGRRLSRPEPAKKLIDEIAAEIKLCEAAAKDLPKVRTLILLWHNPYVTVNFDTYVSRLVETAGAYNVFHPEPIREIPIEMEDMIDNTPELALLAGKPFAFERRHIQGFRKYRIFSKIRIEMVKGYYFSTFGPATAEALRSLRQLILKDAVSHVE